MTLKQGEAKLLKAALAYPGAYEDFPWGERVVKVGKKIFVFLGMVGDRLRVGLKLPESADAALALPFAERTGYNLGKSGWITATFSETDEIPLPVLLDWLDESYRAIAPKKLIRELEFQA